MKATHWMEIKAEISCREIFFLLKHLFVISIKFN